MLFLFVMVCHLLRRKWTFLIENDFIQNKLLIMNFGLYKTKSLTLAVKPETCTSSQKCFRHLFTKFKESVIKYSSFFENPHRILVEFSIIFWLQNNRECVTQALTSCLISSLILELSKGQTRFIWKISKKVGYNSFSKESIKVVKQSLPDRRIQLYTLWLERTTVNRSCFEIGPESFHVQRKKSLRQSTTPAKAV